MLTKTSTPQDTSVPSPETADTADTEDTSAPPDPETADTGATEPIAYFEPYYVHFTTFYGYDPLEGTARWYWADSSSVTPQLVGVIYEAAFLFSEDHAQDACGFVIADADPSSGLASEAWTVDLGGVPGEHLGFSLLPGTFAVGDYTDDETGLPSCREQAFDPALFGESFEAWAGARRWGFGMGELHAATRDRLQTDPDFADLAAMLDAGQLIGGSVQTGDGESEPGVRDASLILLGYPMDSTGTVDDTLSLGAAEMWPESHIPAQGVYTGSLTTWIRTDTLFGL